MESFVLFRGSKRLTLKEDDMTAEKISRIFQVQGPSLFITDDNNVALFPEASGHFNSSALVGRGHYEVHGENIYMGESATAAPATAPQVRFAFHRPPSAAAGSATAHGHTRAAKTFQRNIFIAEVVDGKLETRKTLTVRFSEFEASVTGMTNKVSSDFDEEYSLVLTDGQGNRLVDSEGTRGSTFWKQNSRKIFAVKEEDLLQLQVSKRRRLSRREDGGLIDVLDKIEEVVLAAQGLQDVSSTMKDLMDMVSSNIRRVFLSEAQAAAVKQAFTCIICQGPVVEPMVSTCCQSLIGCRSCTEEWQKNSIFCPKCRADDFGHNMQRLTGISDALSVFKDLLWE
ncbi:hypothetical protein OJAV_G00136260 [Oryzias javanicus]|uniref:RING-type domain-containing protein n=1 Tax=Oryzias javanicus TaxID=123683 RepID=A0A437CMY0_ORYJA|nr:hypothetical protein OJAV_G00136260 [Oryzias javanicus]